MSGRQSLLRMRCIVESHRLELVIAGLAVPEVGNPSRTVLGPGRRCDRRTALGAGIFTGLIAEISSGHARLPCGRLQVLDLAGRKLDRITAGYERWVDHNC